MAINFCTECGQVKDFVTVPKAVALCEISRSTLYYWMKKGWIHWIQTPSGRRLICRSSLFPSPAAVTNLLYQVQQNVKSPEAS